MSDLIYFIFFSESYYTIYVSFAIFFFAPVIGRLLFYPYYILAPFRAFNHLLYPHPRSIAMPWREH